jgi:hypothetical protein
MSQQEALPKDGAFCRLRMFARQTCRIPIRRSGVPNASVDSPGDVSVNKCIFDAGSMTLARIVGVEDLAVPRRTRKCAGDAYNQPRRLK